MRAAQMWRNASSVTFWAARMSSTSSASFTARSFTRSPCKRGSRHATERSASAACRASKNSRVHVSSTATTRA